MSIVTNIHHPPYPKSKRFLSLILALDVVFTKELENVNLDKLPCDVVHVCEVSRPGVTLVWSKDGEEIKPSFKCVYEVVGSGPKANCVHQMTVSNVGPGDQGVYTAQLVGGMSSTCQLTITAPPKINYEGKRVIYVTAGKSCIVEVPYSGAPAPKVNWSFNEGILPKGTSTDKPMTSIDTVYGLTSLQLRRVDSSVDGKFIVQVISNELKERRCICAPSANLSVYSS